MQLTEGFLQLLSISGSLLLSSPSSSRPSRPRQGISHRLSLSRRLSFQHCECHIRLFPTGKHSRGYILIKLTVQGDRVVKITSGSTGNCSVCSNCEQDKDETVGGGWAAGVGWRRTSLVCCSLPQNSGRAADTIQRNTTLLKKAREGVKKRENK